MKNFAISLTCHARLLQAKSGVSSPEKVEKRFINHFSLLIDEAMVIVVLIV